MFEGSELDLVASVVIVLAALGFRVGVGRWIRRHEWSRPEEGRRWLVRLSTGAFLVALLMLLVIWADELRTLALSFVAVAVAIVIATQDFIKSVQGSLMRATSSSFTIGDRVRIGDVRGVVVDHTLLVTTLLEIGPGHVRTGRTVVIPNNRLLTEIVHNETYGHEFILHSFVVPVPIDSWEDSKAALLEGATAASEPYLELARLNMERRARRYSLPMPTVEPFVLVGPAAKDTIDLTVRVPVASSEVWQVEDAVMQHWLKRQSRA